MDWLLSLIPGGSISVYIAAALAALAAIGSMFYAVRKSGADAEKAKEAKRRDENLARIKRAANARPVGGVLDDLRNRDER